MVPILGTTFGHRFGNPLRLRFCKILQLWAFFWASKMIPSLVSLGCACGCNELSFWIPKMVPMLGTCFGTHYVYVFCKILPLWARRRAQFDAPCPRRHDEHTINASRRAKSNDAARASDGLARGVVLCSTWRAAMHFPSASNLHF